MEQNKQQLSALLLCGGKSVRFGSEKGLASFQGQSLAGRIVELLSQISDDVMVSTNRPDCYSAIGKPLVEDVYPGHGPISGIHAALRCARYEQLIVCACDMPFVSPELFHFMVRHGRDYDVVVPVSPFSESPEEDISHVVRYEPLHAIYKRTCLPVIEAAIENEHYKITRCFDYLRVLSIPQTLWHSIPGVDLRVFQNINTPNDLERLENNPPK
jgi:molybdenum cofactor guanylyltransferase